MKRNFSFDNDEGLRDVVYALVSLRWPFEVVCDDDAQRYTLICADPEKTLTELEESSD